MIDSTQIAKQVKDNFDKFPTTELTVFNPISSKGDIDTATGIRNGSSKSASFTVVDLEGSSGSKESIQSNEVSSKELFILSSDIPADIGINSSTVFTLYGQTWSYVSMETVPGKVGIFLMLSRVGG